MGPTGARRVLQIHPTRRCNLTCLHCYSSSGPDVREELPVGLLEAAISDAAHAGYDTLGVSGGEPLLYADLGTLLAAARAADMITTVTTNGMLVTPRKLAQLAPHLGLLAISLDGVPASHDRMRASPKAFALMSRNLAAVRAAGIPFGFIFTLTRYNLDELEWVSQFALSESAALLQIHPLEEVGRASDGELRGAAPDGREAGYAYIEMLRIQAAMGERMHIQLDFVPLADAREHPDLLFAGENADEAGLLADLVAPIVIETDGTVSPLQYGFGRRFALGNLHEDGLGELGARWRRERYPFFRRLCHEALVGRLARGGWPLMNWYDVVSRASREALVMSA